MAQEVFAASIRRKESKRALRWDPDEPLPAFLGSGKQSKLTSTNEEEQDQPNELLEFRQQLAEIEAKKRAHLALPQRKEGGILRLSTLFVLLLLFISGLFFFFGGYLFSYVNPPAGSGIGPGAAIVSQQKDDWRKGTVIQGSASAQESQIPSSYNARRAYLERSEALGNKLYQEGKSRTSTATKEAATHLTEATTLKISSAIRSVVGAAFADVFNPFAEKIVQGTVASVVDQAVPTSEAEKAAAAKAAPAGSDGKAGSETAVSSTEKADAAPAPAEPMALFALELQTYQDSTDAFTFARNLKSKGYTATYVVRALKDNAVVYKVRVGNFANYTDASETRKVIGFPSRVVLATKQDDVLRY